MTNRIATFWSLCLLLAATANAQARQSPVTLSHELLWSFQRVGAPVPSPDGKWVVFSVSELSYDTQKDVADLWVVPADGSAAARRLTSNKGSESGPAWSPDSTRIAFPQSATTMKSIRSTCWTSHRAATRSA
jgi:Tol biopolymer transport system component